jgi:hypothetical protein
MNRISPWMLIGVLLALNPLQLKAWTSAASKTYQKVKMYEYPVEEYRTEHGRLPSEEQFHAVIKTSSYDPDLPLTDFWHREFIYRMPGEHREFDLYSTGADGIDDKGAKDDISNWGGVNEGYHWKGSWPLGRFTLIGSISLAMLVIAARAFRPSPITFPLAGMIVGLGVGLGCFWLLHPGVVPGRNTPLSIASLAGFLISSVSLVRLWTLTRYLRYLRGRPQITASDL